MGEYAIRKSDQTRVKIGTCETMYYLRYEDRGKVSPEPNSVNPVREAESLRFRLPFPDEDNVRIGDYEDYDRGLRLYKMGERGYAEDFADPSTCEDPGSIQLRHEQSGMLLNVPCYHGHKLPEVQKPMTAFWNGKGHSLELASLRPADGQVFPVVRCRHCGHQWRYQWSDIWDYIQDSVLKSRLSRYNTGQPEAAIQ